MEKTDLNLTVAGEETWQYILEQSFSALASASAAEDIRTLSAQIGMYGCAALKSNAEIPARKCFEQLLISKQAQSQSDMFLLAVKDMLSTSVRLRNEQLFVQWLRQAEAVLADFLCRRERPDKFSEFLLSIAFMACDRKYDAAFGVIARLVINFVRTAVNKNVLHSFISDWTSLLAQMSRRKWPSVNDFLLLTVLQAIWRRQDADLLSKCLLQLQLHLQMYCRWDGLESSLAAYNKLQFFYLMIVDYAVQRRYKHELRRTYLRLVLRNVRDLTANIARMTMQDELQVIRQWHDLLMARFSGKMQQRMKRFCQLEIAYWSRTKPKTSKRQLTYLADLLQPDVVSDEYKKILLEIC